MKHIYIINPVAGDGKHVTPLIDQITKVYGTTKTPFDLYITRAPFDATRYVREECEKGEAVRFYSCGGDGTLNEVVSGMFGFQNAELGIIPCGSGNDFVKNFTEDPFYLHNIELQHNAEAQSIDVIKADDRISINICSLGFDAKSAYNFTKFKHLPLLGGKTAYHLAVAYTLLGKMSAKVRFTIDENEPFEEEMLICVAANGSCYGGSYKAAPYAKINDGLIDLVIVKKISRLKFLRFVNIYKEGKHIGDPDLQDILRFERCKKVKAEAKNPFTVNFDGECKNVTSITFEIIPNAIKLCIPEKPKCQKF